MRESAQSWKELLVDLKARGLLIAPEVAVGDGALGFWKLSTRPSLRASRTLLAAQDVERLDKFPKSMQPNAHEDLRESVVAGSSNSGDGDRDIAEKYAPIYDKAVECLIKDRETLLTFLTFPLITGTIYVCQIPLKAIRDGQASHSPHERRVVASHRSPHGFQAGDGGGENLAKTARSKSVAESHQGCQIPRRN